MTISCYGINNFCPSNFSIEAPTSIEGGLIKPKKINPTNAEQTNSNTNKILDFKTGEYIDYNEYLLKNVDMKYFA